MIIDDAKNSLASLRSEISEETRVKSKDDLHVGDILSLEKRTGGRVPVSQKN